MSPLICPRSLGMIVAIVAAAVLFASPITADYRPGPRDTRDQRICGGADNATPAQQIAACTAILAKERDPRNRATAHDYRARGHAKLKRFDAALADANEAIGLQPNDADFLTNRGVLHAEMGEFDLAIRDYSDAIRMNPNDHIAYFNRAKDRRRKNEIDAALDDLSMALKINPKYASALYMRASLFEDLGRFDVALKDVDEVLLLTPRDDRALNLRGLVMEGKGQLDQAVKNYNQAIAIDPAYEGYFFNRGRAHRLMGRYDLSIKDFDRSLEINPARSKYGRGVTFFASGDLERALRDFDDAILVDANDGWSYYYRGRALIGKGEIERGQQDLRRARELTPTIVAEIVEVAVKYRNFANADPRYFASALRNFDGAIALDPDSAPSYYNRALTRTWVAAAAGRFDDADALADFDRAVALKADYVEALSGRGDALRNRKEFAKAVADYDRALAVIESGAAGEITAKAFGSRLHDSRCHARAQLGELTAALADCDEAKRLQPYSVPINRAVVYLRLGRFEEAVADFDAVLKLLPAEAFALHGRGLAKLWKGDAAGGNADLAAARVAKADVGATFASWFGVADVPSTGPGAAGDERKTDDVSPARPLAGAAAPVADVRLWGALACYRMKGGGSGHAVALNQPSEAAARKLALANCAADKRGYASSPCQVTAVFSEGCRYSAIGLNGCRTGATAREALARCKSDGMNNGVECRADFVEGGCLGR